MNLLMIITVEPTTDDDGEKCVLPYQPVSDHSTGNITEYMWFCYNNKCKTKNKPNATCESGRYLSKMRVN